MRGRILFLCAVIGVAAGFLVRWTFVAKRPPEVRAAVGGIKWAASIDKLAAYYISPVLGPDGTLYAASGDGRILAVDPSSEVRWQFRVETNDYVSIDGGLVQDEQKNLYFTTLDSVYSLLPSGLKRWAVSCPPARTVYGHRGATFDTNAVYTTCGEHFTALDKSDGRIIWSQPALDASSAPVLLASGDLAFVRERRITTGHPDGIAISFFPFAPASAVASPPGTNSASDPYIDTPVAVGPDGTLYAGSGVHKFVALNPDNTIKWTFDAGVSGFRSSPVIASDGTIIVLTTQSVVLALAPDGTLKWTFPVTQAPYGTGQTAPLIGSDGTIYVVAGRRLVALSPEGKLNWDLGVGITTASPALAPDGTLYVATMDGVIYAVQTASRGLMQSSWPKYQRDSSNSGRSR